MQKFRKLSVLVPYAAVLVGLYVFENGWLAILLYHFGISAFIFTAPSFPIKDIFKGLNASAVIGGVLFSAAVFPILYFLWPYLQLPQKPLAMALEQYKLTAASWILFMVYFSTVQPVVEELFWRGCFRAKRPNALPDASFSAKLVLSHFSCVDVFFAGYHLLVLGLFIRAFWLAPVFILLVITSALWRKMMQVYNGLATAIISHIVADVSIILAINLLSKQGC